MIEADMDYTNMGRSGLKVSRLALGLGLRGQADAAAAERAIEAAIDGGINFIDCANVYGFNDDRAHQGTGEQVLARVLKRHRDDLVITSKVSSAIGEGPNDSGSSRFHILREIDNTLTRLQTDHVDIYILHVWDEGTPIEETLRALDDVVRAGKTRYVGVSNFQAWQVLRALWVQESIGADPLVCIQNPYNLLNRQLETEMWPACGDQGFGVMTYSPLAVSLLSGVYDSEALQPPPGSFYANPRHAAGWATAMDATARATLTELRRIAAAHGRSVAQTAINWILSHDEVTTVITGGDTEDHMRDNLGAVGWSIDADDRRCLDEASRRGM